MAAQVAYAVGSAVLPMVARAAGSWVTKAVDTWGPAAVANQTIKAAEQAGASRFGTIGRIAGKIIGYGMGPVVAQNTTIRNNISFGGQIAGELTGVAVGLVAQAAATYFFSPKKAAEEPKVPAATPDAVTTQNMIQLELLKEIKELRKERDQKVAVA